ncbi:hypothetical protein [Flavihumibacter fluvii]|uniref:hypothetical protein n=1 Tax=Flavihumibacter fluvii TaxID=2838157 RepID=UPI001BDDE153|nr:hypothetical protein [Flavihumibacter fluvii]ULQ52064.1 hypothetical protein KJS93_18385 [Flavihumibacter fluvii]
MRFHQQLLKFQICCILFLCLLAGNGIAQTSALADSKYDSLLAIKQEKALARLSQEDTVSLSPFWPNIQPPLFFANIRNNITYPAKINQGHSTNFCGYAAMTHLLLKYHPETYLDHILSLYRTGKATLEKKELTPSERVRNAAGTLKNKGELDVLHADQLWFLTLPDQFKGYMNIVDHKYQPGDENKIWAGTNLAKFNRMLKDFTNDHLTMKGSDFIRPSLKDFYTYLAGQLPKGVVLLFVNSKFLYPHKYTLFKLRAPTHFIVLYEMYQVGELIEIKYWDYGLKTEQLITKKRLRKLIFGITTITKTVDEKR